MSLLFLLGLTGVGKSTAVSALQQSGVVLTLLPNRRTLTDDLIVPEVQRAAGQPIKSVSDRLERFELMRRYRETYPGGIVYALMQYLETQAYRDQETLLFDNLRGLEETKAAVQTFSKTRFIFLGAPPLVRLLRLVRRSDSFDQVAAMRLENTTFAKQLLTLKGLETVFDPYELARLEARGVPEADLLKAVHIILGEAQHYDMDAAAAYLRETQTAKSFLQLDTADLSPSEVQAQIRAWL